MPLRHVVGLAVVAAISFFLLNACGTVSTYSCSTSCKSDGTYTFCESGSSVSKTVVCKGPKGCGLSGSGAAKCDTSANTLGDDCVTEGLFRCAPDNAVNELQCTNGKFVLVRSCNGPKKCTFANNLVTCDQTVGDTCLADMEGKYTCDGAKAAINKCTSSAWTLYATCTAPKTCGTVDAGVIGCN
jgi:hypothetical protein